MKQKGSISILALWITLLLALIITLVLGSVRMQLDLAKGKKDRIQSEMNGISVKNILLSGEQLKNIENSTKIQLETSVSSFQNLPIEIHIDGENAHCYYTIEEPLKLSFDLSGKLEELPVDSKSFENAKRNIKERFPEGNGDCIYEWEGEVRVSTKEEYEDFIKAYEKEENQESTTEEEIIDEEQEITEEELESTLEPPGEPIVPNSWYESCWIYGEVELQGYLLGLPKIIGNVHLVGAAILEEKIDDLEVEGVLYTMENIEGEISEELEFLKPDRIFKEKSLRTLR